MSAQLKSFILHRANELGFDHVGIARPARLAGDALRAWLDQGFHGEMDYLAAHLDLRLDPDQLLAGAASVIMFAVNYHTPFNPSPDPNKGIISKYAWGDDYHLVLASRLKQLWKEIQQHHAQLHGRIFVDSAPVLEKEWAMVSGIGWMGKNCCIISPKFGSWIFLAGMLIDIDLPTDAPIKNRCGTCRLCIDACPTGALLEPYLLDSRRCISYLTVELKADRDIPVERRSNMGNRIFGCDVCQSVCPWNHKLEKPTLDPAFYPRPAFQAPWLSDLLHWDEETFREQIKGSPLRRAKYAGFKRNVQIAWNNRPSAHTLR